MSRTLHATHATDIASGTTQHSVCLRLDLVDGTSLGITDHDRDISFNLGDGAITYKADTGILPSALSLSVGFESDNLEVRGPLGSLISRADVMGGRLDRATARLFVVKWSSLGLPAIKLMGGTVAESRVEGGSFVFEVRGLQDAFNQTIGRVITPFCSVDFGSAECGVTVETAACTVTAVSDDMTFTVSGGVATNDYYNAGTVTFTSGDLAGTRPVEIHDYTSGGVVTLFVPLVAMPTVGDAVTLSRGCSKIRMSDDPSIPTCKSYDNVINFRGFPDLTGNDQFVRMPIPGAGGTAV